jgi:hypothetical protein
MKPNGSLLVTSNTTAEYYTWKTLNGGNISGSNADSSTVTINSTGKYVVQATPAIGCAIGRTDTITVLADSSLPVATATVGANGIGQTQLFGGDVAASNYATPFGGSKGLTWGWTGPNGFTSSVQNPIVVDTGTYNLVVTEVRNGCKSSAAVFANFSLLSSQSVLLTATSNGDIVALKWRQVSNDVEVYEVQRSVTGTDFYRIGSLNAGSYSTVNGLSFSDKKSGNPVTYYRIKVVSKTGNITYSNVAIMKANGGTENDMHLSRTYSSSRTYLVAQSDVDTDGTIMIYNISGSLLCRQNISLTKGSNTIDITDIVKNRNEISVITVQVNNQIRLVDKLLNN